MPSKKLVGLSPSITLLSCITALFSLSSCSRQAVAVEIQPAPTATPAPDPIAGEPLANMRAGSIVWRQRGERICTVHLAA